MHWHYRIMAWDKSFIFAVMDLGPQLRVRNPNSWMRALKRALKLPNFCGRWYPGTCTCLTKPLLCFVNGRAIQPWVYTNGTCLEVSFLGIGSYRTNLTTIWASKCAWMEPVSVQGMPSPCQSPPVYLQFMLGHAASLAALGCLQWLLLGGELGQWWWSWLHSQS